MRRRHEVDTAPLPTVVVSSAPDSVLDRLETASKRGRLPGFARGGVGSFFRASAFAAPFDHELLASHEATSDGTRLSFRVRMLPRMPAVFAVLLVVSAWPGVHFVDQLLPASWGWISANVYWWYLPLAVLALLSFPRAVTKSRAAARASAREMIEKIAAELDARIEPAPR